MIKSIREKIIDIKEFFLLDKFIVSKYKEEFLKLEDGEYLLKFKITKNGEVFNLSPKIELFEHDSKIGEVKNVEALYLMNVFFSNLKRYMRKRYITETILNQGENK